MSDEERIELLRRVAACAPEEWALQYRDSGVSAHGFLWLQLISGPFDAAAIINMLDAMEKAGKATCIESLHSFEGVTYLCSVYQVVGVQIGRVKSSRVNLPALHHCEGSTRSIAVSRAFCAVFEKEASS